MAKPESESGPAREESRFTASMKRLREERGWSQAELAQKMADHGWEYVNQMTISRTEKGERPLRFGEARAIAGIFGTTTEKMIAPDEDSMIIDKLWSDTSSVESALKRIDEGVGALLASQQSLEHTLSLVRNLELEKWADSGLRARVKAQIQKAENLVEYEAMNAVLNGQMNWLKFTQKPWPKSGEEGGQGGEYSEEG